MAATTVHPDHHREPPMTNVQPPETAVEPTVTLDISPSGVALVMINRPAVKNAFDEQVIAGLSNAFETVRVTEGARVLFLRGAEGVFSAGADLGWMRRQGRQSRADNEADALALAEMLRALHALPVLTVAVVEGPAFGGGAGLVAACDMALATPDVQFRFSEVRLGLTPATISPYVIEAVGARAARRLFATAEVFGAEAALRLGLIQKVLTDETAIEAEMESIAAAQMFNAPGAVRDAKALVHDFASRRISADLSRDTADRIAARRASDEGREGLAAFLEKRAPAWTLSEN
jgi:methylglutaconyl-CoA hydratase